MAAKHTGENPLDRVLDDKRKKIDEAQSKANGLLARFWRQIMYDLKMGSITFNERLQQYLEIIYPGENKIAASNARGSYNKKFASPEFTFKVFLEALKVMGVFKIEISFKLHHIDGKVTTHVMDALLMNDESRKEFTDKWSQTHGVHQVDPEELKRLEAQRKDIIKAKEEARATKIDKSGKMVLPIPGYYEDTLKGHPHSSPIQRSHYLRNPNLLRQNNIYRKQSILTVAEAIDFLEQDGVSYVRVDNRALTDLGRMLDTQYIIPFVHPTLGNFNTVEGYRWYISLQEKHELLKVLNGHECRKYIKELRAANKLRKIPITNLIEQIRFAMYLKTESSAKLKALFLENTLPYRIFYLNKGKGRGSQCVLNELLENHDRMVSLTSLDKMYKENPDLILPIPDIQEMFNYHD